MRLQEEVPLIIEPNKPLIVQLNTLYIITFVTDAKLELPASHPSQSQSVDLGICLHALTTEIDQRKTRR